MKNILQDLGGFYKDIQNFIKKLLEDLPSDYRNAILGIISIYSFLISFRIVNHLESYGSEKSFSEYMNLEVWILKCSIIIVISLYTLHRYNQTSLMLNPQQAKPKKRGWIAHLFNYNEFITHKVKQLLQSLPEEKDRSITQLFDITIFIHTLAKNMSITLITLVIVDFLYQFVYFDSALNRTTLSYALVAVFAAISTGVILHNSLNKEFKDRTYSRKFS